MLTLARLILAILAAYVVPLTGCATLEPGRRERAVRAAAAAGALLDPCELRCEARATLEPDAPDPCHDIRTARAGTRDGEPVTAAGCAYCGRSALELRAEAGDRHAAQDLAGVRTPRRPWHERP